MFSLSAQAEWKFEVVIPAQSSLMEVQKRVHWSMAKLFTFIEKEATEKHRDCIKPVAQKAHLTKLCEEILKKTYSDAASPFGTGRHHDEGSKAGGAQRQGGSLVQAICTKACR